MLFRKLAASIALSAMVFLSMVAICRQMFMPCVADDCDRPTSSMTQQMRLADGCTHETLACSVALTDHMTSFASLFPAITASGFTFVAVAVLLFVVFAIWFVTQRADDRVSRHAWPRHLRSRFRQLIVPDFLVFAFGRGILHAKIDA